MDKIVSNSKIMMCLFLFLVAGTFVGIAQTPVKLGEAIAKALENNYDITLIKQKQQVAGVNNTWGNAGRYPYVGISAGLDNLVSKNETEDFLQNKLAAGATLNWTLFDGFSVQINKQRFEELEALSQQNTSIVVEGTVQSVILAFYSVLLEKEKLAVYKQVMQLSEDRFKQAEQRKAFGTMVSFDVLQAQNAYLSDKGDYLSQEVVYKNARRNLAFLLAEKENRVFDPEGPFEAVPVDYQLPDLQKQLFANNRMLQNQYINQQLLENALAAAKSNYMSTLNFSAGASANRTRTDYETRGENWSNAGSLYGNFTLSYNLFSGGARKRAVQIAQINEQSGNVEIVQMKHELQNSLENLYELYLVRKELLLVANENLAAAKLNLEIAQEKFGSGSINSFNFRDVQLIYLNAAQQKLRSVYQFIDTHTALLRLTGTILQVQ